MSYKFSMGDRELGDIEFEEDPGTKINFEAAYISFETEGNPILTVSGSNVGIRTTSPKAALDVDDNMIRVRDSFTPASANASGRQGQICWDANYLYICVAPSTWKRVALQSW